MVSTTPTVVSITTLVIFNTAATPPHGHSDTLPNGLRVIDSTYEFFMQLLKSFIGSSRTIEQGPEPLSDNDYAEREIANAIDGDVYFNLVAPILADLRTRIDLRSIPDFHGVDVCWGTDLWGSFVSGDTDKFMAQLNLIMPQWRYWL
jgi:hypothetical protein